MRRSPDRPGAFSMKWLSVARIRLGGAEGGDASSAGGPTAAGRRPAISPCTAQALLSVGPAHTRAHTSQAQHQHHPAAPARPINTISADQCTTITNDHLLAVWQR
jgi:hypothetical protein